MFENIDLNEIENQINNFTVISRELDYINFKKNDNYKLKIEKIENDINEIAKKINTNIKIINSSEEKIILNEKIIETEIELRKYPSQAIGSVSFYNQLNKNRDLFVDNQFNKIIRFLEHVENKEKKYRDWYVNCTEDYFRKPNEIPLIELNEEKKSIDNSYEILSILVNEIKRDEVKFNKVYNKLEDAGLFMTIPEKINQQYLSEISSKLDNVIHGLKVLFQSLEETNRSLREIEGNTSEISSNMYEVSSNLWDISYEISK